MEDFMFTLAGLAFPNLATVVKAVCVHGIVNVSVENYAYSRSEFIKDLQYVDSPDILAKLLAYRFKADIDHYSLVFNYKEPILNILTAIKDVARHFYVGNIKVDVITSDNTYSNISLHLIDAVCIDGVSGILLGGEVDEIIVAEDIRGIQGSQEAFEKEKARICEVVLPDKKATVPKNPFKKAMYNDVYSGPQWSTTTYNTADIPGIHKWYEYTVSYDGTSSDRR